MAEVVKMPRLGLNEQTSVIGEWFVSEGDRVKVGDGLFSIETDKSTMTVSAESDGVILKRLYDNYDVVEVMTPVCIIGEEDENIDVLMQGLIADIPQKATEQPAKSAKLEKPQQETSLANQIVTQAQEVFLSPRARKLAQANGVSVSGIIPGGAEGRIIESDIIAAMKGGATKIAAAGETRTVSTTKIRRVIAKNMMHSLQNTAQLTSHAVFNASAILDYRETLKRSGGTEKGITIGDMVLFAAVKTLTAFDYMNAHMVNDEEITFFSDVNLGVAVDTERGLMVPTVFAAQRLSLPEISEKVKELAGKCKNGNVAPDELSGATFTVSNLGNFGVTDFTPIINPPQVGILGVGTIDYAMKKTTQGMLYYPAGHLSLTYDHRAVDGAPSARFIKALCDNLENFTEWAVK